MHGDALTPRPVVRALARWLEPAEAVPPWTAADRPAWRRAVVRHGLIGHLARGAVADRLAAALPPDEVAWLDAVDARNRQRVDRMLDDLERLLGAAAGAGIEVMPLKGAVLATMPGADPSRRPMADLDLLVRPADRVAMAAVLRDLGYRVEPQRAPRPTHDVYLDPGGGRVVDRDGEHPDNPRRVEVHTEVRRHLWGWVDDDDLTAALWATARPGSVLGRPATLPDLSMLLVHLAIHATSDLLVGRGRLVQWVDLATLAATVPWPADAPHPRQAYPALRLARRAQPVAMAALDPDGLAADVPVRLRTWAERVPLDDRCGLTLGRRPDRPAALGARMERWRPARWRLLVAHGDRPLPVAMARHGARLGVLGVRALAVRPVRR